MTYVLGSQGTTVQAVASRGAADQPPLPRNQRSWPSHGHWNCSTRPPTFSYTRRDGSSHMITGNSSSIVEAYLERRPWVIMLGDSTVRTMYHK